MSKPADTLKKRINQIKNVDLSNLLLAHFNPDAIENHHFFSKNQANTRPLATSGRAICAPPNAPPYEIVLNMVFAFAPISVCDDVTDVLVNLTDHQFIGMLSDRRINEVKDLNEGVMSTLMQYAPASSKFKIISRINKLWEIEQVSLLFGEPGERNFSNFLELFNPLEPDSSKALLTLLQSFNKNERFKLFQTSSFSYKAFIDFFKQNNDEELSLAMLKILNEYERDELKKLVFGSNTGFFATDSNLSHVVFQNQTPLVVNKLFEIIIKLEEFDLRTLLTNRAPESDETPLEIAFKRKDADVASIIIRELMKKRELKSLLSAVSTSKCFSPIHHAAANNNIRAITCFIEHPNADVYHCSYSTKQTLQDIAAEKNYRDIVTLIDALPLYRVITDKHLKNRELSAREALQIRQQINDNPAILICRSSDGSRMLHHAAKQGNVSVTRALLKEGARLEHTDNNNLTAIDVAVENNRVGILECFSEVIAASPDISLPTFALTLNRLPASANKAPLDKVLQTPTTNYLNDTLSTYAHHYNDATVFFILEAAKFLNETAQIDLLKALAIFLQTNLEKLAARARDSQQPLLFCLLFSINPEMLVQLLSSLNLSKKQSYQLGLVLLHGLVQPAIFSPLSRESHQHYLKLLHHLSNDSHNLPLSLASFHLKHSNLTSLPPEILQELSTFLSTDLHLSHVKQRCSAPLIVLTLQKLLNEAPLQQKIIDDLLGDLVNELSLFNKEKSSLDDAELLLFLNLTMHPTLKTFLQNQLDIMGEDSPLQKRLMALFARVQRTDVLLPDSFLRTLFINFATSKSMVIDAQNHPAIRELLAIANNVETAKISQCMLDIVEPQLVLNSRLSPLSSSRQIDGDALLLSQWLYSLNDKTNRFELIPLINKLDSYSLWIKALIAKLPLNNYLELEQSLTAAADEINFLANYIFNAHVSTEVIDKALLTTKYSQLKRSVNEVSCKLGSLDKNSEFYLSQKHCIETIFTLSLVENVKAVVSEIQTVCKRLDDENLKHLNYLISNLPDSPALQPLVTLFSGQREQENHEDIISAGQALDSQTNQLVTPLIHHVIEGLLSRVDCISHVDTVLRWIYLGTSPGDSGLIFTKFAKLTRALNPETREAITAQLNQELSLIRNSVTIIMGLQCLMVTNVTLPQLLETLYTSDDELLLQFRRLCIHAKSYDLLYLIDYLLAAKKESMPLEMLISMCPHHSLRNIADWVQNFIDKLDSYSSRVMSIKVVIEGLYLDNSTLSTRLETLSRLFHDHIISPESPAILTVMCSYQDLLQNEKNRHFYREILIAFNELLRSTTLDGAYDIVSKMPVDLLNLIVQHSLFGGSYDDKVHRDACKNLLSLICQSNNQLSANTFKLIKSQLGRQDFDVLGAENLTDIATEILNEQDNSLNDCTLNGVWIQRLLRSPRFVAAANPQVLQQLIERYRLISLTLKQDEFEDLNNRLKSDINLNPLYRETIKNIENEMESPHSKKATLLKKREELLNFRAEDSIRALLIELEENCIAVKAQDPVLADSALDVLYAHYHTNLSSLRSDLLFQVTDYLYSAAVRNKGDIALAQSTLMGWLGKYLPHKNFEQKELARKKDVTLYDAGGKKIGFVTESNHVMSLLGDEICPMTSIQNAYTGMQFYDDNRHIIGTLSAKGEFKRDNIFQENTSAQLIAKVPTSDLSQSPAALKLLLDDVLLENSLDELYSNADKSRHSWIEEQVQAQFPLHRERVSFESLQAMVKYQSISSLLDLLKTVEHKENAQQLFKAIIADPKTRKALFNPDNQHSFFEFLTRHNPSQQFATFLSAYYAEPWFISGLQAFANYAKLNAESEFLVSALLILNQHCYKQEVLAENTYDAILHTLLLSEEAATIIWKYFLTADVLTQIPKVNPALAKELTGFFYKHHITPLVETLNEQEGWAYSYQYKLLLLIFTHQRKQIFYQKELRYAEKLAWSPKELSQLCKFVKGHNNQKNAQGAEGLGKELLSELIFRCANFGNTELFYQPDKTFDEKMATHTLHRSYLNATARSYIKKGLLANLKNWLNRPSKNKELVASLKDNQAIIEWENISKSTWELNDSVDSMPLISAFLINYSGNKELLSALISDFCNSKAAKQNPELIHNLSVIMIKLPNRDVSACLFQTLEDFFIKNPNRLDETVFKHMAAYHAVQHVKLPLTTVQEKLHLINHFGLQKNYMLVSQCCKLLESEIDPANSARLKKINIEATVENQLHKHRGKWYFALLQFFKRYWNYGFSGVKTPTGSVVFCDIESNYASPVAPLQNIETPIPGGQAIASQIEFHKKIKSLKARYDRFLEKQKSIKEGGFSKPVINDVAVNAMNRPFFEQPKQQVPNTIIPGLR
ncbi:MAG: ankyrin repeat domain-containing protein [Legionella sp.]|nr:ankyrin repeat domain-containing protein [Legionella sp.]